ncbi:MAG TPA: UDP-glucose/GDP-mannose dehydrogenase family protein [Paludibacter sp.]|nr:UDP-glucose/GDP-mannose dehydrogenase family protein [Paludibacter sp.]
MKCSNVLILGITFKENCPDIRNTKVVDIYRELCEFGIHVDVCDPWASPGEVAHEYGIQVMASPDKGKRYDGVLLAVAHDQFREIDFERYHTSGAVVFDAKAVIDRRWVDGRL